MEGYQPLRPDPWVGGADPRERALAARVYGVSGDDGKGCDAIRVSQIIPEPLV